MPKVARTIFAQLAQKLSHLGGGVITQLDFLRRESGRRAFGKRICGTQEVIQQGEGCFYLKVMESTPAASRFLVELPCPLRWQSFKRKTFGGAPWDHLEPSAR